jgi:hypothetical protein
MVRIQIKWEIVSPFLQTISGIIIIDDVNFNNKNLDSTEILRCTVETSNNPRSTGYSSFKGKGYSGGIFDKYKDRIDIMVDSYLRGVMLTKSDYSWVDE